ncbi:MFHA1-like protein [Mya arenaria]|uniref:MFHA1-like protein n=1 Tax=Mya arenaria TaxID=6604 RepID=A0ABY7FSY1_MYAAR|nr:leucine-rich repeat and death domain-containing protein 1-like [Mya arenaria]WAR24389.1 MFHA1-like protein [Mya arenaria]
MIRSSRMSFYDKEILKELRLLVETTDPLYRGQKKLKLRGKDLQSVPQVLFTMMDLEVLDLSPARESCLAFRLPLVPPSIGKLINLKVLQLDTNELRSLPKEISLLHSLERLSLSNNFLDTLPHGIARLKKLRSIHMANNRFEAFPLEVCEIESLEFLDLSDNHLVSIPESISKLDNLRTLLLCYNKIIQLPESLCDLAYLECLWLGHNRLKSLPQHFHKLRRIEWGLRYSSSVLEYNPLVHPPIEICRLGPAKIKEYFDDLNAVREINTPDFEKDEYHANETESELGEITADTPIEDVMKNFKIKVTSPDGIEDEIKAED